MSLFISLYIILPPSFSHMRVDTVSKIPTLSNVHASSNMIVMETTQGLLLGAMLERMGGKGNKREEKKIIVFMFPAQ